MSSDTNQILADVFCDVMEKLAFMFGETAEKDDLPEAGEKFMKAEMNFEGHASGSLSLVIPLEASLLLAANILGLDEEDDTVTEKATDTLGEVLNVTCGNLLTEIYGEDGVFNLSVPVVMEIGIDEWKAHIEQENSVFVLLDDEPVVLTCELGEDG